MAPVQPSRTYRVYGLTLASVYPFAHRLAAGHGAPDLTFSLLDSALAGRGARRVYSSPWRDGAGESVAHLDRFPKLEALRFPGTADFYLRPGLVQAHLLDPDRRGLMELRLLGAVLSYSLERQGIPALHASAVRVPEGAVGFVAHSGAGKSSLAAALVRAGAALLTDDILPVEERDGTFLARPGFPQMRLEPDTAALLGPTDGLAAVTPEDTKLHVPVRAFAGSATPLQGLYLVERHAGPPEVRPLSRSEAVIELVRHSFLPHLVEAAGLQPRRLDLFARLVREVPVRRLLCPDGLDRLEECKNLLSPIDH